MVCFMKSSSFLCKHFFFQLKQYIFENYTMKKVYFSVFAYRAFWQTLQKVREKCLLQLNKQEKRNYMFSSAEETWLLV